MRRDSLRITALTIAVTMIVLDAVVKCMGNRKRVRVREAVKEDATRATVEPIDSVCVSNAQKGVEQWVTAGSRQR